MKSELFEKEMPSFESVLLWKDDSENADELVRMIKDFRVIYDNDPDDFYDNHYDFAKRAVNLVSY